MFKRTVESRLLREKFQDPFAIKTKKLETASNVIVFKLSDQDSKCKEWSAIKNDFKSLPFNPNKNQTIDHEVKEQPKNYCHPSDPAIIYYPINKLFQSVLPDKTGCVYYPNGKLAILLIDTGSFQNFLAYHHDKSNPVQLAIFDSCGNGCVNYYNGNIRFQIDRHGCRYFNSNGDCTKKYIFPHDSRFYSFQPLYFAINDFMVFELVNRTKAIFSFQTIFGGCKFRIRLNKIKKT